MLRPQNGIKFLYVCMFVYLTDRNNEVPAEKPTPQHGCETYVPLDQKQWLWSYTPELRCPLAE